MTLDTESPGMAPEENAGRQRWQQRRTKIICTMGPSCSSPDVLHRMMGSGMDAVRLNFSHGDHETHASYLKALRSVSDSVGKTIPVLQDLQGPKIRLGMMEEEGIVLEEGDRVGITTAVVTGNRRLLPVDFPAFNDIVKPGHMVLIDDGLIMLEILDSPEGKDTGILDAVVKRGGAVFSRKGINIPDSHLVRKGLSKKDLHDLEFGIENDVDFVSLSFVEDAEDVKNVGRVIERSGRNIGIIAKIERAAALRNIEEIISVSDVLLVARGDLGVEIPIEKLPFFQKDLIRRCSESARPVITATHMLESMIKNRMPTRAEVLDIANAVMDGTDAVMLTGETAIGRNPVESVKMMERIVRSAENSPVPAREEFPGCVSSHLNITRNVASAAGEMAERLEAKAIVAFTLSGTTALMLSKTRRRVPVLALTPDEKVHRQMGILWGVTPLLVPQARTTEDMILEVERTAVSTGHLEKGDLVVLTAGVPIAVKGRTNMIKVHEIGSGHWRV